MCSTIDSDPMQAVRTRNERSPVFAGNANAHPGRPISSRTIVRDGEALRLAI